MPNETSSVYSQKKVEDQVLCLDRYFAKQDYENVNREVAKTLVDLS